MARTIRRPARLISVSKLLEKAVEEAFKLPEADQEAVGAWLLAELESERRWDNLFAGSGYVLEQMAAEAIQEDEAGLTKPFDPDEPLLATRRR